jgi:hypothetical protein
MWEFHADFYGIYTDGNLGWFISRRENILYQVNILKRECAFVTPLPETGFKYWRGNRVCGKVEDKIICIPDRSSYIQIYRINDKRFDSIKMPSGVDRWGMKSYIIKQNLLYMISCIEKVIVIADIEKLKIIKTINLNQDNVINSITGSVAFGTKIFYVANSKESAIYEFDANTEIVSESCAIDEGGKYNTLAYDGTSFWLSGEKTEILTINRMTNEQKSINFGNILCDFKQYNFLNNDIEDGNECVENKEYVGPLFMLSFVWKNKVWFFPHQTSHIVYVDIHSYEVGCIKLENEEETYESIKKRSFDCAYKYFYERIESNNKLIIYSIKNDCHYVVDGDTGKCVEVFKDYKITNYQELMEQLSRYIPNRKFYEVNQDDGDFYKCRLFAKDIVCEKYNNYGLKIFNSI